MSLDVPSMTRMFHENSRRMTPLSCHRPCIRAPWVTPGNSTQPQLLQAAPSRASTCALIKKQSSHPEVYSRSWSSELYSRSVQSLCLPGVTPCWPHSPRTFAEDGKHQRLWVVDGFAHACSTSERNSSKTNTLVASFCWYLTHPGHACLCHKSLCSSCCLQHRTNTIHHSPGSHPGLLTGGSNFVLECKLASRFVSKARFEPYVSNTVRLEGTSGQKLFSCRVPQQSQGASFLPGTWPAGLSPGVRTSVLRPAARGAAWSGNTRGEAQNAKEMT